MAFLDFLSLNFLGNTIQMYLICIGIFLVSIFILRFFKYSVIAFLGQISKKTKNDFDDLIAAMLDGLGWLFYILVSAYLSIQWLYVNNVFKKWINYVFIAVIIFYIVRMTNELIGYFKNKLTRKRANEDRAAINFMSILIKATIWIIALLTFLSIMGVNITALVAGLGIGGVAIAFALQNILEDLFSSVSIYFDKPFTVGDFVVLQNDEYFGTIRKIGIKTTRLQSLWGEEIVVSNRELTSSKVRNYKKMKTRRIHFRFGVTYQTPVKKVKEIPEIVEEIFKKVKLANLDRVNFKEFGDSSLIFEVAYSLDTSDYNKYMEKQEEINLALMEAFEKEKIEFAYPTTTVFLKKD